MKRLTVFGECNLEMSIVMIGGSKAGLLGEVRRKARNALLSSGSVTVRKHSSTYAVAATTSPTTDWSPKK